MIASCPCPRHTFAGLGFLALLSVGCSHSEPPPTTPEAESGEGIEHEPVAEVEAVPEPEPEPTAPGMYFAGLTEVTPAPFPAFTAAIDACRDPDNGECTITRTAGFDTRHNHWVVFDVDPGELAPGDAWLGTVTATEQRATFEGRVERRRVAAIRRALGAFRTVTPGQNLVTHTSQEAFSIMGYNALVALGGELEGWAMWIEPSDQHGGYVLHMLRRDQTDDRVLGMSAGDAHCHDGLPEEEDAEGGRGDEQGFAPAPTAPLPCSPLGIDGVLLSPDRASILVLGTRAMNGHGGAPAMHWVVPTPPDLFPAAAPAAP
ncbi:MAG: hypothetical protein IPN77_31755 [Sandaracinaceae bacterium]|nr:hypothetical protein [Sandaracinaceae bacterium]